jgi:SAM-dependent methyltransferase
MERIRQKNVNTSETFNEVFARKFDLYNSYKNIGYYNNALSLALFSGESYLDFGCGGGEPLSRIKRDCQNLRVIGVDISDFVINRNKDIFPECDFYTTNEFSRNFFKIDHVLSSHTFEHVENPLEMAAYLLSRANKSLTIIVPNEDSWKECEQHLWRFDKHSFDSLNPSLKISGLINRGANMELIFHWDKVGEAGKRSNLLFNFRKIFRHNPIGLLKIFLRKFKIIK